MRGFVLSLGVLCLFGLGCSGVERIELPESSLQGTITYKGKPVPYALVVVSSGGVAAQGFADESGAYLVENCPAGDVSIGVNTDAGRGNMMSAVMAAQVGGEKSKTPTFVDVPKKYFDPTGSGITTTLSDPEGINTFDIKIE